MAYPQSEEDDRAEIRTNLYDARHHLRVAMNVTSKRRSSRHDIDTLNRILGQLDEHLDLLEKRESKKT
jgi:hypothetical protein